MKLYIKISHIEKKIIPQKKAGSQLTGRIFRFREFFPSSVSNCWLQSARRLYFSTPFSPFFFFLRSLFSSQILFFCFSFVISGPLSLGGRGLAYSLFQWLRRQKAIFEFWLEAQSPLFCATSFDAWPQGVESGCSVLSFARAFAPLNPFSATLVAAMLNSNSRARLLLSCAASGRNTFQKRLFF